MPLPQGVGAELPDAHQLPLVHASQAVSPSDAWNDPAEQRWHASAPSFAAKLPVPQMAGATEPVRHA